jgi:tripartite-type tricarboxylate transporter receptor subunit TctC
MKRIRFAVGLALAVIGCAALAQADYPQRPVRMLVGFAPGGATDIIARQVAQGLTESLGQSVVVENRPGASSQIAGDFVAKSAPDGYTLLMTTQTLMTSMIIENRTYPDLTRDFAAVSLCATTPLILVTNPAVPARSLQDLIELARSRPGQMNYASGGVGTTPHLGGEMLASMAKLKIVHIPYKGEAPGLTDVLAGQVPFMFSNVTASNPHVKAGKLRALAVTGLQRTPTVPGVPTMSESGLPGFEVIGFFGVMAPAATPPAIVTRLNAEIAKILARPDTRERFAAQALEPGNMSAAQFADYIKAEGEKWGRVIKEAGITAK